MSVVACYAARSRRSGAGRNAPRRRRRLPTRCSRRRRALAFWRLRVLSPSAGARRALTFMLNYMSHSDYMDDLCIRVLNNAHLSPALIWPDSTLSCALVQQLNGQRTFAFVRVPDTSSGLLLAWRLRLRRHRVRYRLLLYSKTLSQLFLTPALNQFLFNCSVSRCIFAWIWVRMSLEVDWVRMSVQFCTSEKWAGWWWIIDSYLVRFLSRDVNHASNLNQYRVTDMIFRIF